MGLKSDFAAACVTYADFDTDGSPGVSKTEITDWIVKNGASGSSSGSSSGGTNGASTGSATCASKSKLSNKIIAALTGIDTSGDGLNNIGEVAEVIKEAKGFIKTVFEISQKPEDLFKGERDAIRTALCDALGTQVIKDSAYCDSAMLVTFIPEDDVGTASSRLRRLGQLLAPRRRLETQTVVTAKAFTPTAADASAGKTKLAANFGSKGQANTVLAGTGATVTSDPTVEEGAPFPKPQQNSGIEVVCIVVAILLAVFGCFLSKKVGDWRRSKKGTTYDGRCCSTGCCSSFALRGWSAQVTIGAIWLLIGALMILSSVGKVVDKVKCVIDQLLEIQNLPGELGDKGREMDVSMLKDIKGYIDLLPLMVSLPALLAMATLLLAAACGARDISTMKCAKCFGFYSMVLLIVSFVFYIIVVVLAVAITDASIQEQIIKVTSICETTLPNVKQTLQDSTASIAKAKDVPNVDTTELTKLQDKLAEVKPAVKLFETACLCLNETFFAIAELFVPGVVCVTAVYYALYSVCGLCCAAKCCGTPTIGAGGVSLVKSSA